MKAILSVIALAVCLAFLSSGKQYTHQTISHDTDTVVVIKVDTTVTGEWGK